MRRVPEPKKKVADPVAEPSPTAVGAGDLSLAAPELSTTPTGETIEEPVPPRTGSLYDEDSYDELPMDCSEDNSSSSKLMFIKDKERRKSDGENLDGLVQEFIQEFECEGIKRGPEFQDDSFSAFQYWRIPVPELDLDLHSNKGPAQSSAEPQSNANLNTELEKREEGEDSCVVVKEPVSSPAPEPINVNPRLPLIPPETDLNLCLHKINFKDEEAQDIAEGGDTVSKDANDNQPSPQSESESEVNSFGIQM
jgi:hypothetical protein